MMNFTAKKLNSHTLLELSTASKMMNLLFVVIAIVIKWMGYYDNVHTTKLITEMPSDHIIIEIYDPI
jgi:hypothetical protein